jgi:hypothetical protein
MTSPDPTQTQFASEYVVDKIATWSSTLDSAPSNVGINISYTIPGSASPFPTNSIRSVMNPYDKKCLTNLSWSVDGVNYYDQDTTLDYYNATNQEMFTQMQVTCGCSNSTIYFFFQSSYTSTQTVYLQYAIDSPT